MEEKNVFAKRAMAMLMAVALLVTQCQNVLAAQTEIGDDVYTGYVSSLELNEIIDGTAAFTTDVDENSTDFDTNGNDSGPGNRVVRSFDTIKYTLGMNMASRSATATATQADIGFEISIDKDLTEASFDLGPHRTNSQDAASVV